MTEAKDWYRLSVQVAAKQLGTDVARGLTAVEAAERLAHYGPNEIREAAQDRRSFNRARCYPRCYPRPKWPHSERPKMCVKSLL